MILAASGICQRDLEEARILAWLATGLRHEAIRLAKRHRRLLERELLILDSAIGEGCNGNRMSVLDTLAAPDDTVSEAEGSICTRDALALLTPQQRNVIAAIFLEERTEKEVAEQLGIAQQAVNRLKRRALRRLERQLSTRSASC